MTRLTSCLAVLVVVGVGQNSGALTTRFPIQTVILSDDIAPGETRAFHRISGPVVNSSGEIAFYGEMSSSGNNKQAGVWLGRAGQFQRIARERYPVPGLPNTTFMYVNIDSGLSIDDNGEAVFETIDKRYVDGVSEYWYRLWQGDATNLAPLVSSGDPAPGTSGEFRFPTNFTLHRNGAVAFDAEIQGDGITNENDRGIWSNASGQLELLAREGHEAPGTGGGVFQSGGVSGELNPFSAQLGMTDSGQMLFRAGLNHDSYSIWMGDSAEMVPLAIKGGAAPGIDGAIFDYFKDANLSSNGHLAFHGRMTPGFGGVTSGDSYGIWAGTAAGVSLVAQSAAQVPDMPPEVVYYSGNNSFVFPDVNNTGEMAFRARLAGDGIHSENDTVLLHGTPGDLHVLLQEGDPIPGMPAEVRVDFGTSYPWIADSGQILFNAVLYGTDVDRWNDQALFAYDPIAGAMMVVREGDLMEVAPGDERYIDRIVCIADAVPTDLRGRRNLTEDGQLVFGVEFSDDTQGIFTTTIPEPSTFALLTMGAVGLLAYGWRRKKVA